MTNVKKRRSFLSVPERIRPSRPPGAEEGAAMVLSIIALSVFSLLVLFSALDAATELRISENHESRLRAHYAARAGLNHARDLLRGLPYDDLLRGPDGSHDESAGYLAQARTFRFRSPLPWNLARELDAADPSAALAGMADDGVVNLGRAAAGAGVPLIPLGGIAHEVPDASTGDPLFLCRYFVKVSDNNGEAAEIAADAADDPFSDGDGVIVVRSLGLSRTIREKVGSAERQNSVAMVEARFRLRRTFDLDAAVVIQGRSVAASAAEMFGGTLFSIGGGPGRMGVGTIDADPADATLPAAQVAAELTEEQAAKVQGAGLSPSVTDVTVSVTANPDKRLLLDPSYVKGFTAGQASSFADAIFSGDQSWGAGNAPDLGSFDPSQPVASASQRPSVTLVDGNLTVNGSIRGAGLLIVTGRLLVDGPFDFYGLVLVAGAGEARISNMSPGIIGGIYIAAFEESGGGFAWGEVRFTVSGTSSVAMNEDALNMARRLIPPVQTSYREITPTLDP